MSSESSSEESLFDFGWFKDILQIRGFLRILANKYKTHDCLGKQVRKKEKKQYKCTYIVALHAMMLVRE